MFRPKNYLIFTDSAADIPASVFNEYDIRVIPMDYLLNGRSLVFDTGSPDREKQCDELYEALRNLAEVHTSQITPFHYEQAWRPLLAEGNDILYLAFSSGLSATYSNALTAAEVLRKEFPKRHIEVVDTLSGTGGQGLLVYSAACNRANGMDISENARWVAEHAPYICHRFTVGDLDYLYRGGRISAASAFIGGMLNIKPLLIVDKDGRLQMTGKARGQNAALKTLVHATKEEMGVPDTPEIVYVSHSGLFDKCAHLEKMLRTALGEAAQIEFMCVSPIIGVHVGPDFFAICTFGKNRKHD
ncbi:MAG: DegV family protein [Lachnospiraceae bacterium]|nr:DegV family protein [Lachnospiraceae bacterium]